MKINFYLWKLTSNLIIFYIYDMYKKWAAHLSSLTIKYQCLVENIGYVGKWVPGYNQTAHNIYTIYIKKLERKEGNKIIYKRKKIHTKKEGW